MDPTAPRAVLKHGDIEYPLAWTKRSEAILSRYGHDPLSLMDAMQRGRKGLYALCVGLLAALPANRAPETPEEIADWIPDEASRSAAVLSLLAIWRNAYPPAAEKKSGSTS
jgi:hypothetical protein